MATLLQTYLFGVEVGRDSFGNRYFLERGKPRAPNGGRVSQKRWVLYVGEPEPTKVPPEWHSWLHYTTDVPLPETDRKPWQKPHLMNKTGTPEAWMPPALKGEGRPKATGDYEAWIPE